MAIAEPAAFGALLRRYRTAGGLTQEALAERAGLSARGISDLERGVSRSHRADTVQRLATALGSILSFFLVDTVFGGSLESGRTAATTTLTVLGLSFILLLERGRGREHIAIQSYMLMMVFGLGALYALMLATAPIRDFFELELLSGTQWFLALLSAAIGMAIASALWRLPQIERLEIPDDGEGEGSDGMAASTAI